MTSEVCPQVRAVRGAGAHGGLDEVGALLRLRQELQRRLVRDERRLRPPGYYIYLLSAKCLHGGVLEL